MKFKCPSCTLRLGELHFVEDNNLNVVCDICRTGGIQSENYFDATTKFFAEVLNKNYLGSTEPTANIENNNSVIGNKIIENIINSYDGNQVVNEQLPRNEFNLKMWQIISGEIILDLTDDFKADLQKMGFVIKIDFNDLDFIDREIIRNKYHHTCQYCGRRGNSVDHKNPVSISHDNSLDNLTLACDECNKIKGNMPYETFVRLNDQIQSTNEKLVEYQQQTDLAKAKMQELKNALNAKTHLLGVVDDPELTLMRQKNKEFQDAYDSLNADYLNLANTRRKYFDAGYKLNAK